MALDVRGSHSVVVVGGGPAGLVAGHLLRKGGVDAVVLEAGDSHKDLHALDGPPKREDAYFFQLHASQRDYEWMPVRNVGGRTRVWGGWVDELPSDPKFQRAARVVRSLLRPQVGKLSPLLARLKRMGRGKLHPKTTAFNRAQTSPWLPQELRPLPDVIPNSIVTALDISADGSVRNLFVCDRRTGKERMIGAKQIVLAASPVETVRLLLASPGIERFAPVEEIGRGFSDHSLSSFLLITEGKATESLDDLSHGAWMALPHRSFLELQGPFPLGECRTLTEEIAGIPKRDWKFHQGFFIHALQSSVPDPKRRIGIHRTRKDKIGRPVPTVAWSWSKQELVGLRRLEEMAEECAETLSQGRGKTRWIRFRDAKRPGGASHEAGGCARVASDGRVQGLRNVWIADASILPIAPPCHPTFTILTRTAHVTSRLIERLR